MKLQPDVIEELSRGDFHVKCERYLGHYTSPNDTLVLEDTDESISLVGNIDPKEFVTGICVALLGYSIHDGSQFLVRDICYAEPNRQLLYENSQLNLVERPKMNDDGKPLYLMVVSGLGFHHEMDKRSSLTQALQDMIDFIWGGGKFSEDELSHRVSRILVVGDNLHSDRLASEAEESDESDLDIGAKMKKSRQVKEYSRSVQAVKHMDDFFAQLSKTINVDVMPGPSDPTSHLMPQQPFHPCMFEKSCMFSTFNCTTNPYHAIYNDNVEILATAGQNVDIIRNFSGLEDPIEIMKHHLKWGNCAPSAPDNLYSVPYEDEDPYLIDFIPDIYIAGCQKSHRVDHYYYASSEESESLPSSLSFESSKDESTMINVTPESIKTRRLRTGGSREFGKPNAGRQLAPTTSGSTPKLAGKPRQENISTKDRKLDYNTPSSRPQHETSRSESDRQGASFQSSAPRKSRTLLVTIPNFYETFSCVLINLNDLECELLSFKN